MSPALSKNIHWLVIGLILIAAYFTGQALVTHFVPTATFSGVLSINSTGEATYIQDSEQTEARQKAFNDAKSKAEQMAKLAGKDLGKLTYLSESTMPMSGDPGLMGTDVMGQPSPEASPGAAAKKTISVSLNFDLK